MTEDPWERGDTLIEVLVAVVIIAIAFVVIVGGLGTAIVGSDLQQNQTAADAALKTAAETVMSDTYTSCATTATYGMGLASDVQVTTIAYWDSATKNFDLTSCMSGDMGPQLVTLTITPSTLHPVHAPKMSTLEVVKGST